MKRVLALATLLSVMASVALSQAAAQRSERAAEEIRRLDNAEREAVLRGDAAALESIWADDFTVTNPFNQLSNKRQVMERMRAGQLRYSAFTRQIEYLRVYGDVAVVMGRETVVPAGERADAGQTVNRRYSAVWLRRDGRWRMITRHANIIAPQ